MKAVALLLLFLVVACTEQQAPPRPLEITRATACALDGMILADYPGPKGQLQYASGEPEFFCDTMELVAMILVPEQKRKITAAYTQDMAKADWKNPQGNWIDARSAFYVLGSSVKGSMGPTLASFAEQPAAESFRQRHGGRVLRFSEITPEMVNLDGGVVKDERM